MTEEATFNQEDVSPSAAEEQVEREKEEPPPHEDKEADESVSKANENGSEAIKKEDVSPAKSESGVAVGAATTPVAEAKPPSDPRLSIPRKAPSTHVATSYDDPRSPVSASSLLATSEIASPSRPGYSGSTVGLSPSISIPMGVDSKLLQGKLLETLKQLPSNLINDALNEYDDALQNKGGSIRNQGAYLFGVIKRYIHVQERAASGNADHVMGKTLTPLVTERLDALVQDGFCTQDEMNDKVKSKIRMLSEKDAIFAIDELSTVERGQIRNFSSYFMGILNRYMRGDTSTGGPSRNRNDRKPSRYEKYPSRDRDDRYRGRSPSRDHDYRRRDDDRSHRYGGDRDRDYRSSRDRSRDRYDDDRGRGGDYRRSTDSSNSYRDRPRYDDQYAKYGRQPQLQQPPQPPPPQQQQFQQQQQQFQQQGQYGSIPPPPPPPPRQAMPTMNAFAPQQAPQQQMFMAPNAQQQVFQQQQQAPQQFVPQQGGTQLVVPPGGSSFVPQQQAMLSQQTPQMGQQSFVPNMQQQPMMANMQQQSAPPSNNSFNTAPSSASWQQQNQSQTQSIPADILGLADKAASAVQALQASTSSAPIVNSVPPQMMPMMQMQGQPQQLQVGQPQQVQAGQPSNSFSSYSNSAPSSQPPQPRRGRTTAKMTELPVMVQYAVQNLQATGHVEGTLDEGILGMINELPEPLALQALQKFSSIDTASMRNKTAYLAGVLRRELEKIQRR